ncbi:MAG: hypothetical protein LUC45_01400 [Paraprevotella sp.]|nr:hypothetical protein [Paraprevotella sp.]
MKKNIFSILCAFLALMSMGSCVNNPVDEDGLLITNRTDCYVSNFDLLGTDRLSVRIGDAEIDNDSCTVKVTVAYGTDLKNLYSQFTLVTDAMLEPKITGLTDFSDLGHPHQYTVVSGNRQVRKTYTVYITVEGSETNP